MNGMRSLELVPSVVGSNGMGWDLVELNKCIVTSGLGSNGVGRVEWDVEELVKCIVHTKRSCSGFK
jgi:hypothetical protein